MRCVLPAAAVAALLAAPLSHAAPAQLTGSWKCMRSVVSASSMDAPMLTFTLAPGSWTDLTFSPAQAVKGRAIYKGGVLKLFSTSGALLHTLRWMAPGDGGEAERLVEVLGPNDRARSGEVCYGSSASGARAATAPRASAAPAAALAGARLRPGGDPFNAFAYPVHVTLNWVGDGVPMESVATFTLAPVAGGPARTYTRTVRQLHTSPAPSYKVPLDQTATLVADRQGRYRLQGVVKLPDGRTLPLSFGNRAEAEIEWTGEYLTGSKQLAVNPPD